MTLAIAGIVAALAWPYFSTYLQAARVKAAAQELSTIVNGARQLAIARNVQVCLMLTGTTAVYRLTGCGGAAYVGPGTRADGTIPLTNEMEISATTANVVFGIFGNATPAGTYTIRDPATSQTMNVVVAASGRVTIQ